MGAFVPTLTASLSSYSQGPLINRTHEVYSKMEQRYALVMTTHFHLSSTELESLVTLRRDLHAHPELGYAETRTSAAICDHLSVLGIEHRGMLAGGTGVVAWIPGRDETDAIALRADIDALPIEEQSGVAWSSTHAGRMHACGHDGHTAILLGAAGALATESKANGLPRPVEFIFQPAEEGGAGARAMIQDGCLDGTVAPFIPKRIYGLHGWPLAAEGTVGTRVGALLAAADRFEITIRGRGAHAAMPHFGRDPILAGAAIVSSLQAVVAREIDPLDSGVVSVTTFNAGTAFNIIPETAAITGTARSLNAATRDALQQRITAIAESVARAYECEAEMTYHRGYPMTINHPDAVARFNRCAQAEVGVEGIVDVDRPHMGGEDFSFYGEVIPACFFLLGLLPPKQDAMPGLHSPEFDFNDDVIESGVAMFRRLALEG
jgi:amidohydrolase